MRVLRYARWFCVRRRLKITPTTTFGSLQLRVVERSLCNTGVVPGSHGSGETQRHFLPMIGGVRGDRALYLRGSTRVANPRVSAERCTRGGALLQTIHSYA